MLNVQGFWTGHVSSRETSRGQGAVAYLISRRVPVTGRRGLVGTVNRVDGEVPGTCNCTVVATRLAVEQAMVAPGMLLAQKCCCLSGLKRGVLWRKRGVLALLGRKCAPPPHGSERWKLLGCWAVACRAVCTATAMPISVCGCTLTDHAKECAARDRC